MSGDGVELSAAMASQICDQIRSVFSSPPSPSPAGSRALPPPLDILVAEISVVAAAAGKVFVHGVGREGLMMKALCMRLYHLGLSAHVVGDVTTPPIAAGDLLLASAGPGGFSTVDAICGVAKSAGARVALLTAQPGAGSIACRSADAVAYIPAQTMADDEEELRAPRGVRLPMGSLYEGALFVLFEMVVLRLAEVLGQAPAHLRSRHTNLE
ncbi:3-hexulose-6-phosphate isomerase [Cocos nucifera]|uniref:3-hexulose-6-phosphate isomerase n=1 Tax=Cocos nucifera TaxID=13894 RepID=A0A8K0ILJ5_COCNU|nr:3-hexulose-6-phosphate isomerase [Cocos nucifera]